MDLVAILSPNLIETFRADILRKVPFHVRRDDERYFDQLLSVGELDDILHNAAANATDVDFYGSACDPKSHVGFDNYVNLNRLLHLYGGGGTIHITNLQKYSRRVDRCVKQVQRVMGGDIEADLWITRHNEQTPYLHYDAQDIIILQIHGSKRWRIYAPGCVEPIRKNDGGKLSREQTGDPVLEVDIKPGDTIYLPPCTPHEVTTISPHSIHVGLGLHPVDIGFVLESAIAQLRDRASILDEAAFWGDGTEFIDQLSRLGPDFLTRAAQQVDWDAVGQRIRRRQIADVTALDDRHFTSQILHGAPLCATTLLERRPYLNCLIVREGRLLRMEFSGGGQLTAPDTASAMLEFIAASTEPFVADELPGEYDLESRLGLLEQLVGSGLLRRSAAA